ncbi:MAG: DNA internalization-related competence protein ComEC/Rec2 [Candidatus Dactylopiibacterium carminicum]|nr:MAG: DNA internalization-related competence protein ComEC/Rec2 [Candidatus Dactylopiibacterium carminicum]
MRLRPVSGNLNPHGFDYEGWAFERGIRASGYVRDAASARMLAARTPGVAAFIEHLRETVRERFADSLPDSATRGVLVALAVGDQGSISATQWDLFAHTGIVHLVSVSGLHITMIAGLCAVLAGWCWRRVSGLALRLPAQKLAILVAVFSAAGYVALAGFGIPAQRTLYMLLTVAVALWSGRGAHAGRCLAWGLLLVLLIDPWAVQAAGFWLSFGAVAALFLIGRSWGRGHWSWQWLRTQWAITLLTLPLLLGLFQRFSLISPLANAVAIPLVSFAITPLALLHALLPVSALAQLADWLMHWLLRFLIWCEGLPLALWQQAAPPAWLVALGCAGALWALLPRGTPARFVGLLVFPALLGWLPLRPAPGEYRATVLDVGQGLAVHVQTATQDLIFDTGPRFSESADAAERVLLPYLRAEGVRQLAQVVLSHEDSDHAGGVTSLAQGIAVAQWRGSLPAGHPARGLPGFSECVAGQRWHWDGVDFAFLHPLPAQAMGGNEGSCVLHVGASAGSLLLTGDITRRAEAAMLQRDASALASHVVLAPHHGSNTSSSEAFVAATGLEYAVFTAGYRNRYGHPAPAVLARYERAGARLLRSDHAGAVRFGFQQAGIVVEESRLLRRRYWHRQVP